mgnify:FL=1
MELMSSFGIDPLDPRSQGVEVNEQFASAPLLPNEGPREAAPTLEQPAVFGLAPQAPAPQTAQAPALQQRPLPYATDVQRPFEAAKGVPAVRSQPRERLPSGVADSLGGPPKLPILSGAPGYETARDALGAVKWALEPREDTALEQARGLESGLNPYQRAGVGDAPEIASARAQTMATRVGALPGVLAGAATSWGIEGIKSSRSDEWDSDEGDVFSFSPEDRRNWDRKLATEDMAAVDMLGNVVSDAVMRSETKSFAQNAVTSAMEFTEATFGILSWLSGGDIPEDFWDNSSSADRKRVIQDIVGPELLPGVPDMPDITPKEWSEQEDEGQRKQEVLLQEAVDRWPELGRELVAFVSALFHQPYEMAHAHPVAVGALVYPLARTAGVKLGPKAADVGRRAYSAMSKYADGPTEMVVPGAPIQRPAGQAGTASRAWQGVKRAAKRPGRTTAGAGVYIADLTNEMWGAFQRWKVDASSVADPHMRPLAEDLLRGGSDVEAGVASLGQRMEGAARGAPDPLAKLKAQFEQARQAEPVPEPVVPPSERFTYRDVPGDELPEVAAARRGMAARKAPPEKAFKPDVLEPDAVTGPVGAALPPQPEMLTLPSPGQVSGPIGRSAEAQAMGVRGPIWDRAFQSVMEAGSEQLRAISGEAFAGRAVTSLDQAALAESVAYLAEVASSEAPAGQAAARLMAMIRDAGGDAFKAASRQWNARNTPRGARPVGIYEAIPPEQAARGGFIEPIADLPEVAATRQVIRRRQGEAPVEAPAQPPDVRAGVEWERARAATSEAEQGARGLSERLDAARQEGLHKTNPGEYAKMYDDALSTSHRLEMSAWEAIEQARKAEAAASPDAIPTSRALTPIEEAPEVINIPDRGPGQTYWPPKFRSPYETPSVSDGLQAPPSGKPYGYQFEEVVYDIARQEGQPATLSPARDVGPGGELVDVAPITREVAPTVRNISPEIMRIVEDAAEWFESGPLRDVPDFRRIAYEEVQAALDPRLANNMQAAVYREAAATKMAAELLVRGRVPVSRKSILTVLEEAAEGSVNDVGIRYKDWQSGEPGVLRTTEVMTPALEATPELKSAVVGTMLNANMHRLSIKSRKLSHQSTVLESIRDWHPDHTAYETSSYDPSTKTVAMEPAAHNRPAINSELEFFKYRYERTGVLPPITRNSPQAILKYAKDRGVTVPGALRRRLSRMKEVTPALLEAFGLKLPEAAVGVRSVRISPVVLDKSSGGTAQLYMKTDLLQSAKYIFDDRLWGSAPIAGGIAQAIPGKVMSGVAHLTKKARVALNPSPLVSAALSNSAAAVLKYSDPLAPLHMAEWALDMRRFVAGVPTKRPLAYFEAFMRSSDVIESSFAGVEIKGTGLLDVAAGDAFIADMAKRGGRAVNAPTEFMSKMFDQPDNIAKGWETMKVAEKYMSELEMLPEGKSIGVPVGRHAVVKLTRKATSKPGKVDFIMNGSRQLTEVGLLGILMKSGAVRSAKTFVNFKNVPLAQVAKRNIPIWDTVFGTPFSGWSSVTSTLPGRQGIVGEIFSGPVNRGWTDYVPLMAKRVAESTTHGAKIGAVVGSQAAQLDEDSELLRMMSAWDPDSAKPTLTTPDEQAGVYNVWRLGSADPIEDLATTIRMIDTATSPREALAYVDPAAVSRLSDRQRKILDRKMSAEDIATLKPYDRRLYKAAVGLSSGPVRGMRYTFEKALDSAFLGGSAIAQVYMGFVEGQGAPGGAPTDAAGVISLVTKSAMKSFIPAYMAKGFSAFQEYRMPDIKDKIAAIAGDTTIPKLERLEMLEEAGQELETAEYLAGSKFVKRRKLDDGSVFERGLNDFSSILFDHWFNAPRLEVLGGKKSVSVKFFREMQKRAMSGAGAVAMSEIKALEALADERNDEMMKLPIGSEERSAVNDEVKNIRARAKEMMEERDGLLFYIKTEFDARAELFNERSENRKKLDEKLNGFTERYMGKGGLERLTAPRQKGREYMRKKAERQYDQQIPDPPTPPGPYRESYKLDERE